MSLNGGLDCFFVGALDRHCHRATTALPHPENWCLAHGAATGLELLPFVLVRFFAADERFIDFNDAFKLFEFRAARLAQPVKDEPCRLLRDSNFLGELHGRNALARRHKQIHRVHLCSGTCDRSKIVPVRTVKSSLH
jgi:hypothetical protein